LRLRIQNQLNIPPSLSQIMRGSRFRGSGYRSTRACAMDQEDANNHSWSENRTPTRSNRSTKWRKNDEMDSRKTTRNYSNRSQRECSSRPASRSSRSSRDSCEPAYSKSSESMGLRKTRNRIANRLGSYIENDFAQKQQQFSMTPNRSGILRKECHSPSDGYVDRDSSFVDNAQEQYLHANPRMNTAKPSLLGDYRESLLDHAKQQKRHQGNSSRSLQQTMNEDSKQHPPCDFVVCSVQQQKRIQEKSQTKSRRNTPKKSTLRKQKPSKQVHVSLTPDEISTIEQGFQPIQIDESNDCWVLDLAEEIEMRRQIKEWCDEIPASLLEWCDEIPASPSELRPRSFVRNTESSEIQGENIVDRLLKEEIAEIGEKLHRNWKFRIETNIEDDFQAFLGKKECSETQIVGY